MPRAVSAPVWWLRHYSLFIFTTGSALNFAPAHTTGTAVRWSLVADLYGCVTSKTPRRRRVSASSITITWPATHLGWILESQTNGLSANNWISVPTPTR